MKSSYNLLFPIAKAKTTMPDYGIPHAFSFDPTHGFDLNALLDVGLPDNEPEDFDEFWQALYKKTLLVAPNIERRNSKHQSETHHIEELYFDTLDGTRVGSYLLTPKSGTITKILVQGHGYGGRDCPDMAISATTASLNPIAPGFHLSAHSSIPLNNAGQHVIHGVENKETYVFRICAAAWWSAATVMLELFPHLAHTLTYAGWSYGGGMGCLMLPWDDRYTGAELGQVSFCHIPMRLTCFCVGSGASTTAYFRKHPSVLQHTLRYFDGAFAAKRIKVPTVFGASLFDPAVPPPGQFCAYNVCRAPKKLSVFTTGHFDYAYKECESQWIQHRQNLADFKLSK